MKTCPRCDSILADNESPYCDNCGYDPDFDRDNEWYSQMSKRGICCSWSDDYAEYCKEWGYKLKKYCHFSHSEPNFVDSTKSEKKGS